MRICFKIGPVEHCYNIPVIEYPIQIIKVGPGPVNFPQLLHDATLVASISAAIAKVSDQGVQKALQSGVASAVQALQKRGGAHITNVSLE